MPLPAAAFEAHLAHSGSGGGVGRRMGVPVDGVGGLLLLSSGSGKKAGAAVATAEVIVGRRVDVGGFVVAVAGGGGGGGAGGGGGFARELGDSQELDGDASRT